MKVNHKEEHKDLVHGAESLAENMAMKGEDMPMEAEEEGRQQRAALEAMAEVGSKATEAMGSKDTAECLAQRVVMVGLMIQVFAHLYN
jgi:hypothetical protein